MNKDFRRYMQKEKCQSLAKTRSSSGNCQAEVFFFFQEAKEWLRHKAQGGLPWGQTIIRLCFSLQKLDPPGKRVFPLICKVFARKGANLKCCFRLICSRESFGRHLWGLLPCGFASFLTGRRSFFDVRSEWSDWIGPGLFSSVSLLVWAFSCEGCISFICLKESIGFVKIISFCY